MEGRKPHTPVSLLILLVFVMLAGCQDIFTYTPLKGLQRDPSTLSAAQKITYGENALASGDKKAMADAYDALKTETSTDAVHLTAQLGFELSGVPGLINEAITNESALTGNANTIADYIAAHPGTDPALMIAGAQSINALVGAGQVDIVTDNDRLLGAIGLAMDASKSTLPLAYDLTGIPATNPDIAAAILLIAPLVESGDTFAKALSDFLAHLPT